MKRFFLAFASIVVSFNASAQAVFDWVETQPVGWDLNPGYTQHLLATDGMNRNVTARFVSNAVNYTGLFGQYVIEVRDSAGNLDVSFPLNNKVQVHALAADAAGNIYVGGGFMETLYLGIDDSLAHVGPVGDTLDVNAFLLKIDANGFLVWARNLELLQPDLEGIADIRIDAQQNPWYAYNDFFNGHIQKMNSATGADIEFTRVVSGIRGISSFDFDPQNNIFVSGAADNGQFEIAPLTFDLTDQYNIFIARFNAAGQGTWAKFAHDVTFQEPQVEADPFGNAFVGGTLMDSLTWGSFHLTHPQWVNDFWLVKVTGDGSFEWAKQGPQPATIEGDVARADRRFIATDAAGDVYMLATVRGSNDFGNAVIIDAGMPSESNMAVVKFSGSTGQAQWAINGGSKSFNNTHQIAVDEWNNVYFTQTVTDTANFGFFHFDIGGWTNHFVIGKISVLQDTTGTVSTNNVVTKAWTLYPNPTSDVVLVPQELQGSDLSVFDVTGKKVMSHQGIGSFVNLETLAPGCYALQFRNERVRFIGRVVKE